MMKYLNLFTILIQILFKLLLVASDANFQIYVGYVDIDIFQWW